MAFYRLSSNNDIHKPATESYRIFTAFFHSKDILRIFQASDMSLMAKYLDYQIGTFKKPFSA